MSMLLTSESFAAGKENSVGKSNAITLLRLLEAAGSEVKRDNQRAETLLGRASALLKAEIDRAQFGRVAEVAVGGLPGWQIRRVRLYIEEHLHQAIRLKALSAIANLSATHFSRSFKRSFGETPHSYIVRRRLEQARHLMLTTNDPLSEIALACGFADQAHLTKSFRQGVNQTPAAWRRQRRQTPHETRWDGSHLRTRAGADESSGRMVQMEL
jgi:AraC family transcriptional regulator